MKFFTVFFCVIACTFGTPIQNEYFALDVDIFNGLIYVKEAILFDSNGVVFEMRNASVEGFSDNRHNIFLEKIFPVPTVKVSMNFPRIFGHVELWNSSLPLIYGGGSAVFDLRHVQLQMEVGLNMTSMFFESVVFKPSIEEVHFGITGVNHNEEYSREFSNIIREALHVLVNDPEMHASVAEKITDFLNGQYRSSPSSSCWWCRFIRA